MLLFLLTLVLVLAAAFCLILAVRFALQQGRTDAQIYILGGVDIDTGCMGTGPEDFESRQYRTRPVDGRRTVRQARGWRLVLQDLSTGRRFAAEFTGTLLLGRGAQGSYTGRVLGISPDQSVSHRQARVTGQAGVLYIQNTGKGLLLCDGKSAAAPTALLPGSILQAGQARLQVVQIGRVQMRG